MADTRPKIRLFVPAPLAAGEQIMLSPPQAHYLRHVMRVGAGDAVALFNGTDGEWRATVGLIGKRAAEATVEKQLRPQTADVDVWLMFAPIKRHAIDMLVQKATELGAARLLPVTTRRTVSERVNVDRLRAIAVEAAEQCGRLSVPDLAAAQALDRAVDGWPDGRVLVFCDETGGRPLTEALADRGAAQQAAILIGPEGGFEPGERDWLRDLPFVMPVSLGPRILRAETAALAALALWQAICGDWRR